MPSLTKIAVSMLAALSVASRSVDAHGKLLRPEAKARPGTVNAFQQYDFVGEINGNDVFKPGPGESWGGNAEKSAQLFASYSQANGHTSLRQLFQSIENKMKPRFPGKTDNICGYTGGDAAAPVTLPSDGVIEWGHPTGRWGFQNDHHGPCEIWCDDKLVLQNQDCRAAFGRQLPARMKIDAAQCSGAKRLQFLWLAVHFVNWQYWLNCVPLAGPVEAPIAAPGVASPVNASTAGSPVPPTGVAPPTNTKQEAPQTMPSTPSNANGGATNDFRGKLSAALAGSRTKFGAGWPGAGTASIDNAKNGAANGAALAGGNQNPYV